MSDPNKVICALLDEVKNYLDITWDDEKLDSKLTGIIERGMAYINRVTSGENDFSKNDKPKELLFDYIRYVRSNALDEFADNYLTEIISLQIQAEVKRAHDKEQAENEVV